jgi:hypothetical protein
MKFLLPILITLWLPVSIYPWGKVGHQTIALIAWQNLSPTAIEKIKPFLGGETIQAIAIWADEYKQSHRNTGSWHYIDLPIRANVTATTIPYHCAQDKHPGGDVVSQIKKDVEILKSAEESFQEKQKALWFLIHFIGDAHMPLHTADDNDAGGNGKKVRFFAPTSKTNPGHTTNLHSLWDNLIEIKAAEDPDSLAKELNGRISSELKTQWQAGNIDNWTFESYSFAKRYIYQKMPEGSTEVAILLPKVYYEKMRPAAEEQLEKAGVRLAKVLEDIFGK